MSKNPRDLRDAIQRLLDESGDGWSVAQYVVAMGLERLMPDGSVESLPWYWAPTDQPTWQTLGLLERAVDEIHFSEYEDN